MGILNFSINYNYSLNKVKLFIDLSCNLNSLRAFLLATGSSSVFADVGCTVCHTTRFPSEVPVSARLLTDWNTDWVNLPTGLLNVLIFHLEFVNLKFISFIFIFIHYFYLIIQKRSIENEAIVFIPLIKDSLRATVGDQFECVLQVEANVTLSTVVRVKLSSA